MKRYKFFGIGVLLLTLVLGLEKPVAEEKKTEMLLNPGFEKFEEFDFPAIPKGSKRQGWRQGPNVKGIFSIIADAVTSHTGVYYLKLEYTKDMGTPMLRLDSFCKPEEGWSGREENWPGFYPKVEIGSEYSFSLWARGKGKIRAGVIEYDAEMTTLNPTIGLGSADVDSDKWVKHEFIYTPTPTGKHPDKRRRKEEVVTYAQFVLWAEGAIYVDDFSLYKIK